jgi:hypothetical protein
MRANRKSKQQKQIQNEAGHYLAYTRLILDKMEIPKTRSNLYLLKDVIKFFV